MLLLKNVRISFPHLYKPHAFNGEGEAKYSAAFLIPKGSDAEKQIREEIKKQSLATFGDKAKAVLDRQNATNRKLLKDGDDPVEGFTSSGDAKNGYAGHWFIKGSSKTAPKVVGRNRQPLTEDSGLPYAGCFVNIQIDIWGQKNQFGSFLNCKLLAVQYWAEGERLGGDSGANIDAFDSDDSDGWDTDIPWE